MEGSKNPYRDRAAAIYAAEGLDACKAYLHLLVRTWHTNPAGAVHILFDVVPYDVLEADYKEANK